MTKNRIAWSAVQWGVMAALAGTLAGCGGGGGDAPPPPPTLVLALANRDTVSHATAAGIMSFASTSSIPLAASSSVADRKSLQAAGFLTPSATTSRWVGLMLQSARASAASSTTGRAHPLAVIGPVIDSSSCPFGGTTSTTLDDRDNSASLSVGDFATVVFNSCVVALGETLSGTATLAITGGSATSLTAGLTFTAFSDVTAQHSLTLNGSLLFSVSTPSSTVANFRTTANGPVVANVTTHLPFSDTVTLQSGFVTDENYDSSVPPPTGATGTTPGRTITTVQGRMASAAAGGTFDVSTLPGASLTKYSAEDYPRSGAIRVKGNTGTLTLTALSASSVRLDLDTNDDGTPESSVTQSWDWLL
jgi:hypothetical protein